MLKGEGDFGVRRTRRYAKMISLVFLLSLSSFTVLLPLPY